MSNTADERKYNHFTFKWKITEGRTQRGKRKPYYAHREALESELLELKEASKTRPGTSKFNNTRFIALLLWEMKVQGKDIYNKDDYKGQKRLYTVFEHMKEEQKKESIKEVIQPFLYINCYPADRVQKQQ